MARTYIDPFPKILRKEWTAEEILIPPRLNMGRTARNTTNAKVEINIIDQIYDVKKI